LPQSIGRCLLVERREGREGVVAYWQKRKKEMVLGRPPSGSKGSAVVEFVEMKGGGRGEKQRLSPVHG